MVSVLERTIWYSGLIGIYSFGFYKYYQNKTSFNQKFHDSYIEQAEKFIKNENLNNLKFVDTKTKLLFLLGVENETVDLTNYKIIEKILEDFSPNFFVYERNLKK